MSLVTKRNNINLPVIYIFDKSEFNRCTKLENVEPCSGETQKKKCSLGNDETIVCESTDVSFESPNSIEDSTCKIVKGVATRKRRRSSSSCSDNRESPSRSDSPEITYGGTPVLYKLRKINGEFHIIKEPMCSLRPRTKTHTYKDVELSSDSDSEGIFDNLQKSGVQVIRSRPKVSKNENLPNTRIKAQQDITRVNNSETKENSSQNTPSKSKLAIDDEVPLRLKLRRSTEQSNYKIDTNFDNGEGIRRSSRKSSMGTPKRCGVGDCDQDHNEYKKVRGTTPKTPKGSSALSIAARTPITRRMRKNSESGSDNYETILKNDHIDSSKMSKEATTPRSVRPRRNSRLVNYNYDSESITRDKENKSNDDSDYDSDNINPGRRNRKLTATPSLQTPQKRKLVEGVTTPKRPSSSLGLAESVTPKRTPRKSVMSTIDEAVTPTMSNSKVSRVKTPSVKNGNLTPSMSRRTINVGKPATILEEARARLHVSAVPKSLPCREEEFNDIFQFLERKLLDNNSGCIYISGVPGTGKTATVTEVIRCLKKLVSKGDLANFDFIEINGMKLSEPRQAYVQILKQMNGQTATWEQAYQILEKRFTKSSAGRPMTLLLVDELDLLCNKRQDVVYNLLDWPAKANAQLVVITIANTMDLPERVLMGRVTSRLGLTRLTFQPYNYKQLQEIVMARLKDSNAFKSEAIQLVSRKVAAVSGDARRALDICRRSTEIAELNGDKIVTMQDVNKALTEMIASAKVQAIKHCSEMEKLFLQAVSAEVTRTGVEETSFYNVYRQLDSFCSFEGLKVPNVTQAIGICSRLGANRLLLCEHSRTDTQQRILLNVSSDDIHFAMQKIAVS